MSLHDYRSLNLSTAGDVVSELHSSIEREAKLDTIPLTPAPGALVESPAFLTPAMLSWYRMHISPKRQSALAEIKAAFESRKINASGSGFLLEAELSKIEQQKAKDIQSERDNFFQSHHVRTMTEEIARLKSDYRRRYLELGRDAKIWSPGAYYTGLIVIMLLEYPLNLAAFLKIPFLTPALATASVTVLAIVLAFSSHMLGTVLRQWSERFGGNVTGRLRADSRRWLALGVTLLVIGGAAVVFSRSYLVAEQRERDFTLGDQGSSPLSTYGIAFIGNLAVYAAGVAWVMFFHDPVPDFAEERHRLKIMNRRYARESQRKLDKRVLQHAEKARRDAKAAQNREIDQSRNLNGFQSLRSEFDQMQTVDGIVTAVLMRYREKLVEAISSRGVQFVCQDDTSETLGGTKSISSSDFLMKELRLGYA